MWLGAKAHRDFAAAMNSSGRPMVLEVVAGYLFLQQHIADYANVWRCAAARASSRRVRARRR